jgi:glucose/arabinose dehydrogenase
MNLRALTAFALLVLACSACSCFESRRALVGAFSEDGKEFTKAGPTEEAKANAEPQGVKLERVADGLTMPTDIQFVPGSSTRLVVLQKGGQALRLDLESTAEGEVRQKSRGTFFEEEVDTEVELGLLGLAFHPRFADNGRFFVHSNPKRGGKLPKTRLAEWHADPGTLGGARFVRTILEVDQPYQNHNGGQLAFGPDGMLYLALGDGGWRGDPEAHGQNLSTWLGSILRVDVEGATDAAPYRVPADNPFVGREDARDEIYIYGLRNPWRFSFDDEGRLIIADVGQDKWEEVDVASAGANLGWKHREGRHCYQPKTGCPTEGLTEPVFEYGHDAGQSITGGFLYKGRRVPSLAGQYVVADFVRGSAWALRLPEEPGGKAESRSLGSLGILVSTFGRSADGELWVADFGAGALYRLGPSSVSSTGN